MWIVELSKGWNLGLTMGLIATRHLPLFDFILFLHPERTVQRRFLFLLVWARFIVVGWSKKIRFVAGMRMQRGRYRKRIENSCIELLHELSSFFLDDFSPASEWKKIRVIVFVRIYLVSCSISYSNFCHIVSYGFLLRTNRNKLNLIHSLS